MCLINTFKKYLFGLTVLSYLVTVIGVPVYLHYCGGKVESVNVLVKANTCCDEEEDAAANNGCCKDEGLYLQNHNDFTLKANLYQLSKISFLLFFNSSQPLINNFGIGLSGPALKINIPPPKLYSSLVVGTTVLRI